MIIIDTEYAFKIYATHNISHSNGCSFWFALFKTNKMNNKMRMTRAHVFEISRSLEQSDVVHTINIHWTNFEIIEFRAKIVRLHGIFAMCHHHNRARIRITSVDLHLLCTNVNTIWLMLNNGLLSMYLSNVRHAHVNTTREEVERETEKKNAQLHTNRWIKRVIIYSVGVTKTIHYVVIE